MPYNFDYPEHEISILDKVVYCADKLEHLRTDKDVNNIDKIREMVNIDINKGFDFLYNQLKK
jgi:HD superfamily phosphohydrolase YqeK